MCVVHTTVGLRACEVESYWKDIVCRTYAPLDCRFDPNEQTHRFDASIMDIALGRAHLTQVDSGASRYVRTFDALRRTQSDEFLVCLMTAGRKRLSQSGREIDLGPGDLCIIDTAKAYALDCPHRYEAILLKIARQDFIARLPSAERNAAILVSARGHYAQLAATMLKSTAALFREQKLDMASRVVAPLVDLLSLAFDENYVASELDGSRYARVIERAQEALLSHLTDSQFDVSLVPRMIGVSTRTLSRAFAQMGTSPARWLWQKRLELARDLLTGPRRTSVSEVAMNSGFNDFSHFSRAFKRRFNVAPSSLIGRQTSDASIAA
jgi:AraC-like DNA-binding protein